MIAVVKTEFLNSCDGVEGVVGDLSQSESDRLQLLSGAIATQREPQTPRVGNERFAVDRVRISPFR